MQNKMTMRVITRMKRGVIKSTGLIYLICIAEMETENTHCNKLISIICSGAQRTQTTVYIIKHERQHKHQHKHRHQT